MRRSPRLLPILFAAALVLAPAAARAGSPEAEALFQEGLRHMDAKEYAAACPLFERSEALEPAVGALYQLGDCYVAMGRTASAWSRFDAAAKMAGALKDDVRAKAARGRAEALATRLVYVVVAVDHEVAGLVVTVRDAPVPRSSWGLPVPVDPGTFSVRATAPHKRPFEIPLTVRGEGTTQKVTVPALVEEEDEAANANATTPATPPATTTTPATTPATATRPDAEGEAVAPRPANGWQKPAALVAGGLGVVGIGIGSYFGLRSISKHGDASSHCDASTCDAQGLDANKDAVSSGTVSTVMFVVGGALLATGITLWLTAPGAARPSALRLAPQVGPHDAGVFATGAF